jgi:type I restriction-modification system DNA methylase subunit
MAQQLTLPIFDFSDAVEGFAAHSAEERGAIFTRREVVEFILDLSGYTVDQPLQKYRLLEPSIGHGDFLLAVAERLLTTYESHVLDRSGIVNDLSNTIRAVEVHRQSI